MHMNIICIAPYDSESIITSGTFWEEGGKNEHNQDTCFVAMSYIESPHTFLCKNRSLFFFKLLS